MANKYNNNTSIRFDEEIKTWLYRKSQIENRSLGNLVNTILKREKEREENTYPLNFTLADKALSRALGINNNDTQ